MVTLQLRQLRVPPGQRLCIQDVSWREFEDILTELGDRRGSRVAYANGVLEIRMPLPEHEFNKEIIGDMVKILLEELDRDRECFGSTTFKRQDMAVGIEPDNCFYVQNYRFMIGKKRVNLAVDPPPDLVIEVDLTSKTQLDSYELLGVPELWRFEDGKLKIDVLKDGTYQPSLLSPTFPDLPVVEMITDFVEMSQREGSRVTLKAFRQRIRGLVASADDDR